MTVYDYMSKVIRECREYVEKFKNEKGSILFTGNTGCGKTFLSNCIARELIRRYFSVVYLTATDMFDILAGSRFNGGDDDEAKDRASYILDCDLLMRDPDKIICALETFCLFFNKMEIFTVFLLILSTNHV